MGHRLKLYLRLMRFHRPIGIFLLLWPTLWALWIAGRGRPDPEIVTIFVAGVILMRAAGCVINDLADRHFDPHVARTRDRPLASGEVSPKEAILLFGILLAVAFLLVLKLNGLTIALSFPAAFLAASYPFTKRFFPAPQAYLGLAFGWAVPMAFAAQTGSLPAIAWLLLLATLCWAVAYDTIYALIDREDDRRIGIHSTALLFEPYELVAVAGFHGAALLLLFLVGRWAGLDGGFHLGLLVAALLAGYQLRLIRDGRPESCLQAFNNNGWLGGAIFLGLLLDDLLR